MIQKCQDKLKQKIISLQNVMEKIINDIITSFLFNILKLLRS